MTEEQKSPSWFKRTSRATGRFFKRQIPFFVLGGLLLGMGFIAFFHHIVVSINPGELGVLWRRLADGTVLDRTYNEGLHFILPFNRMYRYNVRNQKINDELDVLTVDGLTVKVDYSIRYYLKAENLPLLHAKVGPNYADVVVKPEVRSTIRTIFGQFRPEEIYTSQRAIQEQVNEVAREKFHALYVGLDGVPIHKIELPKVISSAIEEKLATQQREKSYVFRRSIAIKEAERLQIEANGLKNYNKTLAESLDQDLLRWYGVKATEQLSKSDNSKVVVIGSGKDGLPIILGQDK
ncbi:prohibitin family protein [Terasakiella sp. A23]|uniref:prohibitin family protein n=1 Tax=Terasakiella sp. FCG-A23 TaxID=3080561 RepID=UPI002955CAC9|nr:prohibitin family protein [Terasakiella sp. A23]MDV7340255.1 prohibitin family protein [Terasakiella sp. A23]